MIKIKKFIFLSTLLLFSNLSFGQIKSGALEVRNKLESDIQKNLKDIIGTRLDLKSFTVAASVNVAEVPKAAPPKKEVKEESYPLGMGIGLIDVRELVESYEKQIEELKILKEETKTEEKQYDVKKIEVIVGLDVQKYDKEFRNKFRAWLIKRVKNDYGSIASADVSELSRFTDPSESPTATEDNFTLKDLINLMGPVILMLGLILAGLLIWLGLRYNAKATKEMILGQNQAWSIHTLGKQEDLSNQLSESPELREPTDVRRLTARDIDHILGKIAMVCLEIGQEGVSNLVRVWIDSGSEGITKTAILIDAILGARERIMNETGVMPELSIPIDKDIINAQEEALVEEYRKASRMNNFERFENLEKIYWDLVSVKTLGLQSLRRPFDYLQSINSDNLIELFQNQKSDIGALALMYLPNEIRSQILEGFEPQQKEEIITQMLDNNQISQRQIWDLDTTLKVSVLNQSAEPTEKLVNLFPRTIEVLQSLDALGEMELLRKICPSLKDQGLVVKKQYSTLAFVDEWNEDYVKQLTTIGTSAELVSLIKAIPTIKESVLRVMNEKSRIIIEDDLKIVFNDEKAKMQKDLSVLKSKWVRKLANENIPMSKVIKSVSDRKESELYAA
jgi:hypothetical protein